MLKSRSRALVIAATQGVVVVVAGMLPLAPTAEAATPLWQRYAPLVRLHPDERYFPARPIGFFIANSELRWSYARTRYGWSSAQLASVGNVSASRLGRAAGTGAYRHGCGGTSIVYAWQHTRLYDSGRPACLASTEGFYLNVSNTRRGGEPGNLANVPVFYRYVSGRYIAYWFFYAYNDAWWNVADHEGDWERIVVDLSGAEATYNRPTQVAYYTHGCAPRIFSWGSVQKVTSTGVRNDTTGTHPIVYSARGSHGSWREVGDGSRDHCNSRAGVGEDQVSAAGRGWRTWNLTNNLMAQPWRGYGGAWGNRGNDGNTTGPLGPEWKGVPAGW
jgi:hypothetical protein